MFLILNASLFEEVNIIVLKW